MPTGAITGYIDVAQLVLYAFWLFFAGLIFYLRREDRREGYPLEPDLSERFRGVRGSELIPFMPKPKLFYRPHDGTVAAPEPRRADVRELRAERTAAWPGAPLRPVGDPMLAGVGAGGWAEREDVPERTIEGEPLIVPLRVAEGFYVEPRDPDPRGMAVVGADGGLAGTVVELWVDRAEPQIRYLEVELPGAASAAATADEPAGPVAPAAEVEAEAEATEEPAPAVVEPAAPTPAQSARVLLPIHFARISAGRRQVKVGSILARHFADVPTLRTADEVTKREEDRITAYYAAGQRYAEPSRAEPLL